MTGSLSDGNPQAWKGRRVLVTGAGGFIGGHLVGRLKALGANVFSVGRHVQHLAPTSLTTDLECIDSVERALRLAQPEFVFHLAARANREVSAEASAQAFSSVVQPALNLVHAVCRTPTIPRLIFFGSCDEYGNQATPWVESTLPKPRSPYGLAKATITQVLMGLPDSLRARVTIVRPSVVYGPGQPPTMFIPQAIQVLASGRAFEMTNGTQTRDFVYVEDVVEAVLRLTDCAAAEGQIFNVGSGRSHAIRVVGEMIADHLSARDRLRVGALPAREGEVGEYSVLVNKLGTVLGWTPPTSLEMGLRQTIAGG